MLKIVIIDIVYNFWLKNLTKPFSCRIFVAC